MKKVTICSSIRNQDLIKLSIKGLKQHQIKGLFPNIEFQPESAKLSMDEMRKLQEDHFKAIRSSDAVYVINPDGYIGTMVTAEIGFALGNNKPVYYSEATGEIELDALTTGIISLDKIEEFRNL